MATTQYRRPKVRNVQVDCATVEVLCPHCSEPQPCIDDGSHLWPVDTLYRYVKAIGESVHKCVSCDEPLRFVYPSTAPLRAHEGDNTNNAPPSDAATATGMYDIGDC
jgi:hypothetical protein